MVVVWGTPSKSPAAQSVLAGASILPREHKESHLFCCDWAALPTTAAAKEREGKPAYSQKPKIDAAYKNQATNLSHVYKSMFMYNLDVYQKTICGQSGPQIFSI